MLGPKTRHSWLVPLALGLRCDHCGGTRPAHRGPSRKISGPDFQKYRMGLAGRGRRLIKNRPRRARTGHVRSGPILTSGFYKFPQESASRSPRRRSGTQPPILAALGRREPGRKTNEETRSRQPRIHAQGAGAGRSALAGSLYTRPLPCYFPNAQGKVVMILDPRINQGAARLPRVGKKPHFCFRAQRQGPRGSGESVGNYEGDTLGRSTPIGSSTQKKKKGRSSTITRPPTPNSLHVVEGFHLIDGERRWK